MRSFPAFRTTAVVLALGAACASRPAERDAEPADAGDAVNQLTEAERAEGWQLLFDGQSLEGWRGFRRDDVPAGWRVEDGALAYEPGVDGGDLMTVEQFADFELSLEWKISPGGNSGIMFRVTEDEDAPWKTATEMQVLDNSGHGDGRNSVTSTGANYALYPPVTDATRPVGEWNTVRIVARGPEVAFWLNGTRVVEFEVGSDDWSRRVAASKFAEFPGYGLSPRGHIDLQDHGDRVWYRNIKIRVF